MSSQNLPDCKMCFKPQWRALQDRKHYLTRFGRPCCYGQAHLEGHPRSPRRVGGERDTHDTSQRIADGPSLADFLRGSSGCPGHCPATDYHLINFWSGKQGRTNDLLKDRPCEMPVLILERYLVLRHCALIRLTDDLGAELSRNHTRSALGAGGNPHYTIYTAVRAGGHIIDARDWTAVCG
jgi:hypothetical protein